MQGILLPPKMFGEVVHASGIGGVWTEKRDQPLRKNALNAQPAVQYEQRVNQTLSPIRKASKVISSQAQVLDDKTPTAWQAHIDLGDPKKERSPTYH